MPKETPDRDDERGGFGSGGPQDGPIGGSDDKRQGTSDSPAGEGAQRHEGGSSRDSENLS
ncbi:MAG TPA: hypothetical protein VGB62_10745 [Allosphingosinicella sp.]|jgi:hypothetical protein